MKIIVIKTALILFFGSMIFLLSCGGSEGDNKSGSTDTHPTYVVTFDKNNADATGSMSSMSIVEGTSANLTANSFLLTGWAFEGWAETPAGGVVYADQAPYTMGSSDKTFYAKWTNAAGLTSTSVTLVGQGNPGGNPAFGWFRYATVSPGTCNDSFGLRLPASGSVDLGSGTVPVTFSRSTVSPLSPNTTYYFCSIVSSVSTSYGTLYSFTTPAD